MLQILFGTLLVTLFLATIAFLPVWPYSRWGLVPSGVSATLMLGILGLLRSGLVF